MLVLRVLEIVLPGIILAWALLPRSTRVGECLDALAFGPLLGCGLVSSLDLVTRVLLGRALAEGDLLLLIMVVFGLVIIPARRRSRWPDHALARRKILSAILLGALALASGLVAWAFLERFEAAPDGGWDGMAIWGLLGRILAGTEGNPRLALATTTLTQTDYPLFLPGSLSLLHQVCGRDSALPGQVMAVLGYLGLVMITQRILLRLVNLEVASLGALLVLCTPAFLMGASDQYADVFVAAANLAATGLIFLGLMGGRACGRCLLLGGLFLGSLPWIKNEGLVLAIVLLSLAVFYLYRQGKRAFSRGLALIVAGAAPGLAATLVFHAQVAPEGRRLASSLEGASSGFFEFERWSNALAGFGREVSTRGQILGWNETDDFNHALQRWGLLFVALAAIALLNMRPGRGARPRYFVAAVCSLQLAAFVGAFALIPERQDWQIENAASRLLMQVVPLVILGCLLCCRSTEGSSQQESEE